MKRLLLDQGLPRSAAEVLRSRGWNVIHVGECGMASTKDAAILDFARGEGRAIVTLDADFHALLAVSGETHPTVLRIRQEGLKGDEIAGLVEEVFGRLIGEGGYLVTVAGGRVRMKMLPILR